MMKNKIKEKILNNKFAITLFNIVLLNSSTVLAASDNKYAKNTSDWLIDGIKSIAICIVVGKIAMHLIKSKMVALVTTVIVAGIIMAIVYNPEIIKTLGNELINVITG